jgi:putative NIF3 family GTP cyclohydrolase 1 type 2
MEFVNESRLEMVYPKAIESRVLDALRASHPYEEIAFDLIEMKNRPPLTGVISGQGYGVYGDYKNPIGLNAFLSKVKKGFHLRRLMISKPEGRLRKINRVAYTPGSGGAFMASVLRAGCDAWVTGELGYHKAIELARSGVIAIELGHTQSEYFFAPTIEKWLKAEGVPTIVMRSAWPEIV